MFVAVAVVVVVVVAVVVVELAPIAMESQLIAKKNSHRNHKS